MGLQPFARNMRLGNNLVGLNMRPQISPKVPSQPFYLQVAPYPYGNPRGTLQGQTSADFRILAWLAQLPDDQPGFAGLANWPAGIVLCLSQAKPNSTESNNQFPTGTLRVSYGIPTGLEGFW